MARSAISVLDTELGWIWSAASTSPKMPAAMRSTLAWRVSSAGVPMTRISPGKSGPSVRDATTAAAALLLPMRLWPHAWPIPGNASYSATRAIDRPGPPDAACHECRGQPSDAGRDREPFGLQEPGEPPGRLVLLEGELGMGMDPRGEARRARHHPVQVTVEGHWASPVGCARKRRRTPQASTGSMASVPSAPSTSEIPRRATGVGSRSGR